MSIQTKIDRVFAVLLEKYPHTFFPDGSPNLKPLRTGIFTRITGENRDFSRTIIARFLSQYTSTDGYFRALVTCQSRIDLNGSEFEPVLDKHRKYALQILSDRQQKRLKREAA